MSGCDRVRPSRRLRVYPEEPPWRRLEGQPPQDERPRMFWHFGGERGSCCCWDRCRCLAVEHGPMIWARLRQGWQALAQRREPRMGGGAASCRGGPADKAVALQDVVGEGEPAQCAKRLVAAAHGDLVERPLAAARVDALGNAAALVAGLAGGAAHAPAPGSHAGAVVVPWREGVGVV